MSRRAGAHAASAGTYILYATSLAAMAPGTNLGAATPISLGGGDDTSGSTLHHKIINDAVAEIRALAEMHHRNADWAEKAVREAATLTATQAKGKGVSRSSRRTCRDLLAQADGRSVVTAAGHARAAHQGDGGRARGAGFHGAGCWPSSAIPISPSS